MRIEIEVPDDVLERLERKAAASEMTINDYFVRYLEQTAAVPTREEVIKRLDDLIRADIARAEGTLRDGRQEHERQRGQAAGGK